MVGASQRLKTLQTKLKEAVDKHFSAKEELRQASANEFAAAQDVQKVRDEIQELQIRERDLIFTEHSFIRYFERVLGYDLEKVKEEILPKTMRDRVAGRAYVEFRVSDTHMAVVRDGRVMTVVPLWKVPKKIRPIKDDDESVSHWDTSQVGVVDVDGESGGGTPLQDQLE